MKTTQTKYINIIKIILIFFASLLLFYIIGIIVQFVDPNAGITTQSGWNGEMELQKLISYNFFTSLAFTIGTIYGLLLIAFFAICISGVFFFKYLKKDEDLNLDERGFRRSEKGSYGTSGFMTPEEMRKVLIKTSVQEATGTILGIMDGQIICSMEENTPEFKKYRPNLNKHIAIYGASGTGKSRCFVRPQIIQCCARGESIVVTDPKGEIYSSMSDYLRQNGYDVKTFNLVSPEFSDSWNCLAEISSGQENQIELMAQTFVEVIIKNTGNGKGDHFWDSAEMNLLKALCLYVITDKEKSDNQKNIGTVYEMLTNSDEKRLTFLFEKLPLDHPCRSPYSIFKSAGDNVRGNIIIGLGSRLQVFQSDIIRKITTYSEIDLEQPARKKTAIFVIMSDQESTLNFLSTLFFSFLFIRLVKYADVKGNNGKCDIPVNFILDEFPNIGSIPDFTKKLSTIRSRDLRVAVIFQNIAQLKNRYPDGLWEEIIGNCDTQLFLGCTDQMTAAFISSRTGEMTIEVSSQTIEKQTITLVNNIPDYKESQSSGKRAVMTPDEVMRLENTDELIIIRGQKVLKAKKFDYSAHPESEKLVESKVANYTPRWRASTASKNFAAYLGETGTKDSIESVSKNLYNITSEQISIENKKTIPIELPNKKQTINAFSELKKTQFSENNMPNYTVKSFDMNDNLKNFESKEPLINDTVIIGVNGKPKQNNFF